MKGLGTIINVVTVLVGGTLGLLIGKKISKSLHTGLMDINGLISIVLGVQMAIQSKNILIVIVSLLVGFTIGELINIQEFFENISKSIENKFAKGEKGNFAKGFLVTSILFCIGPMTIIGSIQDGISGDYKLLATKSVMDGIASIAFASSLGAGVLFTALTIIIVQGGLTLFAGILSLVMTQAVVAELTAVGGILIISIGLGLLEIRKIRTANMLPALIIAPIIVNLVSAFF